MTSGLANSQADEDGFPTRQLGEYVEFERSKRLSRDFGCGEGGLVMGIYPVGVQSGVQ